MAFRKGDKVEVASNVDGYQGSYFEGTVVSELLKSEYIVRYKNLFKNDFSEQLLEVVSGDELRPVPCKIPAKGFRPGDIVDAYSKDGWWVGMICGKIQDKYVVYFELYPEFKYVYPMSRLRVHQDWVGGAWISCMRYEDKAVGSSRLGQCIRLGNNMKQRKMLDFWMEVWDLIRGKDAPTPVFDFQEKRRIGSIVIKNTSAGVVSCIPISYALHVRLRSLLDIRVAVVKISSPMHREPIYKLKCKSEVCKCFLYERGVPRINTPPPLSSRSVTTYEGGLIAAPKPLRVPPNLVNPLDDMSQPWTISPTKSKMEPVLATWQFISSDHPACSNARFIRPG